MDNKTIEQFKDILSEAFAEFEKRIDKKIELKFSQFEEKIDQKFIDQERKIAEKLLELESNIDEKLDFMEQRLNEQFISLKIDMIGDMRVYFDQRIGKMSSQLLHYVHKLYEEKNIVTQ